MPPQSPLSATLEELTLWPTVDKRPLYLNRVYFIFYARKTAQFGDTRRFKENPPVYKNTPIEQNIEVLLSPQVHS